MSRERCVCCKVCVVFVVQDVVDCHPGLSFLQDAPEFHSRYIHTVSSHWFHDLFPGFPQGKGRQCPMGKFPFGYQKVDQLQKTNLSN